MRTNEVCFEFRKIAHLAEQSEAMVLHINMMKFQKTTFRFEQNLKPKQNSRSVKTDAS